MMRIIKSLTRRLTNLNGGNSFVGLPWYYTNPIACLFGISRLIWRGTGNRIECKTKRLGHVRIYVYGNNNHILIEDGVIFKKGKIWCEDNGCTLIIGKETTIENAELAVAEDGSQLTIGEDCMLSSDIRITTTDSHSIIDLATGKRTNPAKSIHIGDHVWIGYNSNINKGVTIGSNAIVAGNTLVTKDVPSSAIVAGIPGRLIKEGVTWSRKRI